MGKYREAAITQILIAEGGYVDDPHDPGGETKYGISKRAYPDVDIRNLTEMDARAIYADDYWYATGCHLLPPAIAMVVFDFAVNSGSKRAVQTLQRIAGVLPDGLIGPKTRAAVEDVYKRNGLNMVRWYNVKRLDFLQKLDSYPRFARAWHDRIQAATMTAAIWHVGLTMLAHEVPTPNVFACD